MGILLASLCRAEKHTRSQWTSVPCSIPSSSPDFSLDRSEEAVGGERETLTSFTVLVSQ